MESMSATNEAVCMPITGNTLGVQSMERKVCMRRTKRKGSAREREGGIIGEGEGGVGGGYEMGR